MRTALADAGEQAEQQKLEHLALLIIKEEAMEELRERLSDMEKLLEDARQKLEKAREESAEARKTVESSEDQIQLQSKQIEQQSTIAIEQNQIIEGLQCIERSLKADMEDLHCKVSSAYRATKLHC